MRNKKHLISLGIASGILVLGLAGVVLADDSTTGTTSNFSTRFHCSTSTTGTQTCRREDGSVVKKIDNLRAKARETRIEALGKLYQAQLNRAQNAFDRMSNVLDRITALRAKFATTANTADLSKLDGLITQANTQKQTVQTDMDNVKAKANAIKTTLTTAQGDTQAGADVQSTTVTSLKQEVKDFQTSVKTLKQDMIAWHKTLQDSVSILKNLNGQKSDNASGSENDTNATSTPKSSGQEGND